MSFSSAKVRRGGTVIDRCFHAAAAAAATTVKNNANTRMIKEVHKEVALQGKNIILHDLLWRPRCLEFVDSLNRRDQEIGIAHVSL